MARTIPTRIATLVMCPLISTRACSPTGGSRLTTTSSRSKRPEIAAAVRARQFVMVKPGRASSRCCSARSRFVQILRDGASAPLGVSVLKQARRRRDAADLRRRDRTAACSASGRSAAPFSLPDSSTRGLDGRRRRRARAVPPRVAETPRGPRRGADALLRRPTATPTCSTWTTSSGSASVLVLATEDGSRGERGPRHACRSSAPWPSRSGRRARAGSMRAAPSRCWPRVSAPDRPLRQPRLQCRSNA